MKAHRKLWELATSNDSPANWCFYNCTIRKEFEEMNNPQDINKKMNCTEIEERMWLCFYALLFGGDLEV